MIAPEIHDYEYDFVLSLHSALLRHELKPEVDKIHQNHTWNAQCFTRYNLQQTMSLTTCMK